MSADNYRDPGPRARWAEIKRDPSTLGVVLQRLGQRDSVETIVSAWQIPRAEFLEWLVIEGRKLCQAASASKPRP